MDGQGNFENLPDDEFRYVLEYLNLLDAGSLRCTAKRLESRVTCFSSLFNKLHIHGVNETNIDAVKKALDIAMAKPHDPELETLELMDVEEEAALNLLKQGRHTVRRIIFSNSNHNNNGSNPLASALFKIPNLMHVKIHETCNVFKFVLLNPQKLVSLDLRLVRDIPEDTEWPQLPNLRELGIDNLDLLSILPMCRETLECLVVSNIDHSFNDSEYVDVDGMVIPKLTDLYIINQFVYSTNDCLRFNQQRLEFLYLEPGDLDLDGDNVMETLKNVVMNYPYDDDDLAEECMPSICPNADIVYLNQENQEEIKAQIKARCKKKGFHMDLVSYVAA